MLVCLPSQLQLIFINFTQLPLSVRWLKPAALNLELEGGKPPWLPVSIHTRAWCELALRDASLLEHHPDGITVRIKVQDHGCFASESVLVQDAPSPASQLRASADEGLVREASRSPFKSRRIGNASALAPHIRD